MSPVSWTVTLPVWRLVEHVLRAYGHARVWELGRRGGCGTSTRPQRGWGMSRDRSFARPPVARVGRSRPVAPRPRTATGLPSYISTHNFHSYYRTHFGTQTSWYTLRPQCSSQLSLTCSLTWHGTLPSEPRGTRGGWRAAPVSSESISVTTRTAPATPSDESETPMRTSALCIVCLSSRVDLRIPCVT